MSVSEGKKFRKNRPTLNYVYDAQYGSCATEGYLSIVFIDSSLYQIMFGYRSNLWRI
jgi:hypothetical protein